METNTNIPKAPAPVSPTITATPAPKVPNAPPLKGVNALGTKAKSAVPPTKINGVKQLAHSKVAEAVSSFKGDTRPPPKKKIVKPKSSQSVGGSPAPLKPKTPTQQQQSRVAVVQWYKPTAAEAKAHPQIVGSPESFETEDSEYQETTSFPFPTQNANAPVVLLPMFGWRGLDNTRPVLFVSAKSSTGSISPFGGQDVYMVCERKDGPEATKASKWTKWDSVGGSLEWMSQIRVCTPRFAAAVCPDFGMLLWRVQQTFPNLVSWDSHAAADDILAAVSAGNTAIRLSKLEVPPAPKRLGHWSSMNRVVNFSMEQARLNLREREFLERLTADSWPACHGQPAEMRTSLDGLDLDKAMFSAEALERLRSPSKLLGAVTALLNAPKDPSVESIGPVGDLLATLARRSCAQPATSSLLAPPTEVFIKDLEVGTDEEGEEESDWKEKEDASRQLGTFPRELTALQSEAVYKQAVAQQDEWARGGARNVQDTPSEEHDSDDEATNAAAPGKSAELSDESSQSSKSDDESGNSESGSETDEEDNESINPSSASESEEESTHKPVHKLSEKRKPPPAKAPAAKVRRIEESDSDEGTKMRRMLADSDDDSVQPSTGKHRVAPVQKAMAPTKAQEPVRPGTDRLPESRAPATMKRRAIARTAAICLTEVEQHLPDLDATIKLRRMFQDFVSEKHNAEDKNALIEQQLVLIKALVAHVRTTNTAYSNNFTESQSNAIGFLGSKYFATVQPKINELTALAASFQSTTAEFAEKIFKATYENGLQ